MFALNEKNFFRIAALALITLMAITRVHHFGGALSLPDASLAVFFLMGLLSANRWLLGFLLLEAGLVDYLAIDQFGVSDWCISPAYIFLIPTYAVMWLAGRYCTRFKSMVFSQLAIQFGILGLATSTAFLISNGSFYLLSARFSDMPWGQYMENVAQYYPAYMIATLIYAGTFSKIIILGFFLRNFTTCENIVPLQSLKPL